MLLQVPLLLLAAQAQGWWLYAALLGVHDRSIFGAIPFTDAMIVRYVDDRMRSRVAGMRLAVSLGISSLAVWLLGPLVKGMGFDTLLLDPGRRRAVHRVHGAVASVGTARSRDGGGVAGRFDVKLFVRR